MKNEILEFIQNEPNKKWATRKIRLNDAWVEYLNSCFPTINSLPEQLRFLSQGHTSTPLCHCGQPVKFAHAKSCSKACAAALQKDPEKIKEKLKKTRQTNLKKYGVENPSQSKEFQSKRIKTLYDRYGAGASPKARTRAKARAGILNEKGRQTLKEKYGVDNPGQLPDHKEKLIAASIKKFGVPHYTQSEEYKKRLLEKQFSTYNIMCDTVSVGEISKFIDDSYVNPNDRITFTCNNCGTEQTLPTETFKYRIRNLSTPCRKCSNLHRGSCEQSEIADFVKSLTECTVLENDRSIIAPKELDIVIPDLKLAIEYCGLFWHNDTRIAKEYHLAKREMCFERGFRLITVFQDEWMHRREIVKSRLRYIFKKTPTKIYARKCTVKEITAKEANQFLNQNHLQGSGRSNVRLGAFNADQLVAVMTFSKPNIAKGAAKYQWELNRFASLIDYSVIGIANKLFKTFTRMYEPESVISYADLRWSFDDSVYQNLGFRLDGFTNPGYWYINGDQRIHRFALRKNKNDDQSLTEYENRLKQGYYRIWDCGHARFVWTQE